MASRGMGVIARSKMPRKDDTDKVATYKKGGKVKKMAEGDLVKDVKVKPTSATSNENYTGLGANISGDIPLSEKEKLAINADISASKAKGQGVRGSMDSVTAEYKRKLDKNTDLGASISRDSSGKNRYGVSYNKRFAEGGKVSAAALIDGNEFLLAAQRYGLGTDNASLNRIVNLVNQGETVESAAKKLGGKK